MNYTYQETIETSAYSILLEFEQPISQYFTTDDFEIGIRDQYTNYVTTITKSNWQQYGMTDDDPLLENRPKNSLYKNGGILMYCPDNKSLYIKQLVKCTNSEGANIGFNSSEITVWFTDEERIRFNTFLFPKLQRDAQILQVDPTAEDPLLPEPNMRQEFNYDQNAFSVENVNKITTNYEAGNEDAIYVNTDTSVPCYYSTVSAIMRTTNDITINPCNVSSYLYDDDAQTYIDIPYDIAGPFTADMNLPDNLIANAEYYTYTQKITSDGNDLYKNRLVLGIGTTEAEILDSLNRLIFNLEPTPSDKKITRKTTGELNVTIKNPNPGYITRPTVYVDDVELDYSTATYNETTGDLTFKIENITDERNIKITAWLDINDDPIRTADLIKSQTQNEVISIWQYAKLQLDRFIITSIQSFINDNLQTSNSFNLDKNDKGKMIIKIKNPNTDYNSSSSNIYYMTTDTDGCTVETGDYDSSTGELTVIIDNITLSDDKKTRSISLDAYMNQETEDFTLTEVINQTYISTDKINWTYSHVVENLNQLTITNVKYYIIDGTSETEVQPEGSTIKLITRQTGKITATITNPNTKYISTNGISVEKIVHTDPTQQCELIIHDYNPTTGTVDIELINITITDTLKLHNSQISTYMTGSTADFDEDEVKRLTPAVSNFAAWIHEETESLDKVTFTDIKYFIDNVEVTNSDNPIKLRNEQVGKITATINNPNTNYKSFTIFGDLIEHPETESCSLTISDTTDGKATLTINNIKVSPSSTTHNAQVTGYLHQPTPHFNADEVKEITERTSEFRTWIYEETLLLSPLVLTFTNYNPVESDNGIHWLAYNKTTGVLPTGSVTLTIYNPNTDYRDLTQYPIDLIQNLDTPARIQYLTEVNSLIPPETPANPQTFIISSYDFSQYASTGYLYINLTNITVQRTPEIDQTKIITANASINIAISYLPVEEVKNLTRGDAVSDTWKYKISTPDIGPDDEYRKYSLYTISDLEINGGEIGSRDIACKNLTVNNGGVVHSNIGLADGYTFTSNGNNTFNGEISASNIVINNPATFNKPLYVTNSIFVNNITLDTVYVLPDTQITLMNSANITHILTWENPKLPEIKPIESDSMTLGTTNYRGNGNIFGTNGEDGTSVYKYKSITFDNSTGYAHGTTNYDDNTKHLYADFYPGKYYMDSLSTVVDTRLNIHNYTSTDGNDGSVSFYINSNASFSNNTVFNADASGIYDFRIYYAGNDQITVGVNAVNQAGTIKAPNGTVSFANNARWKGSIWAKKIILNQGAILTNDIE